MGRAGGSRGGRGEELSGRAEAHIWGSAPPPQPRLLPILGEPWGATLGQCPGSEVDRLTFFAWAQRQRYPGLSDFSTEQLITPSQRSDKKKIGDKCSPVITHPFSKEGLELHLYLGTLHSRKHQSRTKEVKRDSIYFLFRGRNIKCSPVLLKLRTKNKIPIQ